MKLFTTCVGYADLLAVTLPAWRRYGHVFVITRPDDWETGPVVYANNAQCVRTSTWFTDSPTGINKGAAMNAVIHNEAKDGEQIVLFDADCYPRGVIPVIVDASTIVSCHRYQCDSPEALAVSLQPGALLPKKISNGSYRPELVRGYFQTFQFQRALSFGRKRDKTFSGCDLFVASQFLNNQTCDWPLFHVLHLGQSGVNWKGRITEQWK